MVRPRWHDALLIAAIAGLLAIGIWSLWWDEVRSILHLGPAPAGTASPVASSIPEGQT